MKALFSLSLIFLCLAPALLTAQNSIKGEEVTYTAAEIGMDFKGVVSFHGGLAGVPAQPGVTKAKILVCHGAADKFVSADEVKNFRNNLDSAKVDYQFIAYLDAVHVFTNPDATALGKKFNIPIEYNEAADKKSWADMQVFFKSILNKFFDYTSWC